MNKDNENRKLEIILPRETAEKLYQVLMDLVMVLKTSDFDSEKTIFEEFVEQRIEARRKVKKIELSTLINEVKILVITDIEAALKKLQAYLPIGSEINNDVIGLLSRHNRVKKALNNGTIHFQIADNEYNKIITSLLFIIDNLDEESLKNDVS